MAIYKLGDVAEIISGKGINNKKNNKKLNNYENKKGKINWLLVRNFKDNKIDGNFEKYDESILENNLIKLEKNELVYSMYATPALSAINENYENLYINQSFCKIIPNNKILDIKYLNFYFHKNRNNFVKLASGTTQKNLNTIIIKNFIIDVPSLEIQKSIIDIIETHEELFLKHNKLVRINNLENTKKDIQNLIDIIEPIEKIKNNLIKIIEKQNLFNLKIIKLINLFLLNTKKYKLKDIFEIKRGNVINGKYLRLNSGIYPVISSNTKNNGIFGYINSYMYDGEYITMNTDGYAGTFFLQNGKFSITNVCIILIPKIKNIFLIKYIFYLLKNKEKDIKSKNIVGTSRPAIRNYSVEEILIEIPSLEIQNFIIGMSNEIKKMNFLVENLEEKILKLMI
ncbi:restriction endonuclease subunit S [[Mycoplasma] collis]|uniref:restriction endonuclease subunit S n=1 Tax=[Mycoplasma] collis TaxID=2127 RepID=UPI00051C4DBA|nr:restriction endonuclease subunit S [[Mycoplasma] collis]